MLKNEYLNTLQLQCENLSTIVETYESKISNYVNYILKNESFSKVRYNSPTDANYIYNISELQKALSIYYTADNSLTCAIYFSSLDYISSPNFSYTLENYFYRLCLSSDQIPSYDKWKQFFTAEYDNSFLITASSGLFDEPCLIYAHTFSRAKTYCTIFIAVPLNELTFNLRNALPDDAYFLLETPGRQLSVFDKEGAILSDSSIAAINEEKLCYPDSYTCISSTQKAPNINCYLLLSDSAVARFLSNTQNNFYLTLGITLALGFCGILFFLYTNYRPISNMLTRFPVNSANKNEYTRITSAYELLEQDFVSTQQQLERHTQELTNQWLLSLLKGRVQEQDLHQKGLSLQIEPDDKIALIGFLIPYPDSVNLDFDNLLFFIVNNIFQELFSGYRFHHIEDGRLIFYLFRISPDEAWSNTVQEKINYLCRLLCDKWNTPVIGIVGRSVDKIDDCAALYQEIIEEINLKILHKPNTLSGTIVDMNQIPEQIPDTLKQQLNAAVMQGDLNAALYVSSKIFNTDSSISFPAQKLYVFDAFSLILEPFKACITTPIQQMTAMNYLIPLLSATTPEQLTHYFNQVLIYMCGEIAQNQQTEIKEIISAIKKHIAKNYSDQSLNVNMIAYTLNRNPKYISRIFKECTGEGLHEYINHFRINSAIELMQQESLTLVELSTQVGFNDPRTFRRAFVKYTGKNPGNYKKETDEII